MCAAHQQTGAGRIVGVESEAARKPAVEVWKAPDEATVDAMPPLTLLRPMPAREEASSESASSTPMLPPALPEGIAEDSSNAYLFFHAREAAAVARTIIRREQGAEDGSVLGSLSAEQLVAAILIGLGQEIGGAVCKHLTNDEIQWVSSAIAETHEVGHQLAMQALEMVRQRIISGDYVEVGGPEYARGMLTRAIGPYRANHCVDRSKHLAESGFDMLNRVEAD